MRQKSLQAPVSVAEAPAAGSFHVFNDCVYSYEYALANRELAHLTGVPEVPSGLADGFIKCELGEASVDELARRLAYFDVLAVGERTIETHQKRLSSVSGAIAANSGKAYMTHWMYPYKGKFHPQMIRALLNVMDVKKGETVLDPMTGSGTVNVEASLLEINSVGIDCSPVGVLAAKVKASLLKSAVATAFAKVVPDHAPNVPKKGLEKFLENTNGHVESRSDEIGDALRLLEFEVLSISQLPNKKVDEVWKKLSHHYKATAIQASKMVRELGITLGRADVRIGDARATGLPSSSIDGIITSPPYAIALDYVSRNEIQLEKLGYEMKEMYENTIGLRGKKAERIALYYKDMHKSVEEMHRVLKPGKFCAVVIGDTRFDSKLLPTVQRTIDMGKDIGFELSANMRKVSAGRFGLFRTENILLFQK